MSEQRDDKRDSQEALIKSLLSVVYPDIREAAAKDLQTILELERAKSAEPQRAAALDDIERRIVAMIRYVSMKAGVAETTYGAMCHEARCILRNAHLDYDALSAVSSAPLANTEQTTYLGALITAFGEAQFDCGAWTDQDDEPYDAVLERSREAKVKLLQEIARIRSHGPATAPEHVCGLTGYNPMIDPPCPGCVASGRIASARGESQ